ncbi:serine-enriched protein-like [Haliotis rubra]|uniref:serine-enriched protein-like n=1 Tax=Haliotis rubra TaxID=36100 RepID=UPI001EE56575|nr:serine-enriched protein-like [Haliotis rubra]
MNRYDSRVCLLDADVLEFETCQVNEGEVDAESSSSGYDSSDMSSDEDVSPTNLPDVVSGFTTLRPASSRHNTNPHNDCRSVMVFKSTGELQDSLALILEMPDMCDVTFLVGKTKVPVYGVKAILATRSRYLYQLVLKHQKQSMQDIPKTKKIKKVRESPLSQRLLINVPGYLAGDFKAFIKFVHSGKARIDLSNVIGECPGVLLITLSVIK